MKEMEKYSKLTEIENLWTMFHGIGELIDDVKRNEWSAICKINPVSITARVG